MEKVKNTFSKFLPKPQTPFDYFGMYLNAFSYFGLVPFTWNQSTQTLKYNNSGLQKLSVILFIFCKLAQAVFLFMVSVIEFQDPNTAKQEYVFLFMVIIGGMVCNISTYLVYTKGIKITQLYNKMISHDTLFRGRWFSHSQFNTKEILFFCFYLNK